MKIDIICEQCGQSFKKERAHVNRARKLGFRLFCDRNCAGLARRVERSVEEKKEMKRLYDIEYRKDNQILKLKKAEYYKSPSGRAVQKRNRARRKDKHLEYIRTDAYKKWKHEYDQKYQAKKNFGEFWESKLILKQIEKEIEPEIYKVKIERGTYNKSQKRKRLWNSMQKTLSKHYGTP